MDCEECENLSVHKYKDPNCQQCMPINLMIGNAQAYEAYLNIRQFGEISFEAIDRYMVRFGVDDEEIFNKIAIIHKTIEAVRREKREVKNGHKHR